MRWLPHLTVACIVEKQDKLLFVEEYSQGKPVLNQPAGHIEENESLEQAAIRETLEESACLVEPTSILGIYSHHSTENDITYFRVCFRAKLLEEFPDQTLDSDIIRTHWLAPEIALAEQKRFRSPLVKSCIEDYVNNKSYPLSLITELPKFIKP